MIQDLITGLIVVVLSYPILKLLDGLRRRAGRSWHAKKESWEARVQQLATEMSDSEPNRLYLRWMADRMEETERYARMVGALSAGLAASLWRTQPIWGLMVALLSLAAIFLPRFTTSTEASCIREADERLYRRSVPAPPTG